MKFDRLVLTSLLLIIASCGMPRAADIPSFEVGFHPVPAASNPLGVKGCGEAGVTGALPAVVNAILDALAERGVTTFDMPATPERVWAALGGQRQKV